MTESMYHDVRNAIFNLYGTIDCEINHVSMGWIPFTASPDDSEVHGRELYADLVAELYGPVAGCPVSKTKEQQKQQIADQRYKVEIAGIVVDGLEVNTKRSSRVLINEAVLDAMADSTLIFNWKVETGFVTLTSQQVIDMGKAIRVHVQACFDREAVLSTAVDEGTYLDSMLEQGWPPTIG